ncbi:AMP-binding protein [Loktanella sp. IMCC34160]|uniref:AMP-binding protein n=1 Tax=Loktanella sp. IMCC34160 TaxID=2510646 RepID=UPI0013EA67D8|nr:AMP-binding protein [Loktanella sp. IMCC34160]
MPEPATDRFHIHAAARLTIAGQPVALRSSAAPCPPGPVPVCDIAPLPLADALPALVGCLASGAPFCVSVTPAGLQEPAGTFHTATSGSTGAPKRIRRSHASWIASFRETARRWGVTPDDRLAVLGGLDQSLSLYALVEGLHLGVTVDVLTGLRPDRQAAALDGVTLLYATPTQVGQIVQADRPLPALRHVAVGGGAFGAAQRAALARLAPNASVEVFYGAAETSFATLSDATTPEESVGRPYPGVDLRVDEASLVWLRSPYLFDGYAVGHSDGTQIVDGWVTVGETGYLDDAGNLFLTGRADRMFTVADRNLHPETIEAVLTAQPGVTHAAILPLTDAKRGAVPVGFYAGDAAPEVLMAACRAALGPGIAPRWLRPLPDWPLLPGGKTDLRALSRLVEGGA